MFSKKINPRRVTINNSVYPICLPPPGKGYSNSRAFVVGKCNTLVSKPQRRQSVSLSA